MTTVKPPLTDETFARSIFTPSKNPTPKGLRRRRVVRSKGRNARRVRSFNKLPAKTQTLLDTTGNREAYLRGEKTIGQARTELRAKAVRLGWAQPPRVRVNLRGQVLDHLANLIYRTGHIPDLGAVGRRVDAMSAEQLRYNQNVTLHDFTTQASVINENNRVEIDGEMQNGYWYHDQ